MSKKIDDGTILPNCNIIVIFLINGQIETMQKPGSGRLVCKSY